MAQQKKANPTVQHLGMDVKTTSAKKIIKLLEAQKNTVLIESMGQYREDPSCTMVFIDTYWSEEQLDAWLYKTKGIDYIGTFVRRPDQRIAA